MARSVKPFFLAAGAIALLFWVILFVATAAFTWPDSVAGPGEWLEQIGYVFSITWLSAAALFVGALALGAPAWIMVTRLTGKGADNLRQGEVVKGLIAFLGLGSIVVAIRAAFWWDDFRHSIVGDTLQILGISALVGAIWGVVFRALRPKSRGQAA